MLKVNTSEKKRLKFNISVSGVQPQDLTGSMRIMIEKIEYGFPILIENGDIIVNIEPLSNIVNRKFKDGEIFEAHLDIVAGNTYLKPWADRIQIENPMKIEATLTNEEDIKETKTFDIKISSLEEEVQPPPKPPVKKIVQPKTKFGKMLGDK
jgi:hypothetical protein